RLLRHLRVTNFAILSDVALDFGHGLNVLSGETGAGKSLIVEAVNLLRGGRASADIPRAGTDEAVVEAIFEVPEDLRERVRARLVEAGLPGGEEGSGGEFLVRRLIHRGGRSRTYVNGALTTATRLAELGEFMVDLSGQHQHQGLVDPRRHAGILDEFSGRPELAAAMAEAWDELRGIDDAIERLAASAGRGDRAERADFVRFQLEELAGAGLTAGEDEELVRERARFASVERLESGARAAEQLLYGGDGAAVERLDAAARELERLRAIDGALGEPVRSVAEARILVEDAAAQLRAYADRLEGNPERLAEIDERLALISRLKRKHGGALADVLARAAALERELADLDGAADRIAELDRQRAAAEREARTRADRLSEARREAAARLVRDVAATLGELGMGAASLSVAIEPAALGPHGADRVELMLCANRGEEAKPLARIASGGELSRIMLALKLALRHADPVATYVFDEVDAGIGGQAAEVVGHKMRQVAGHRQVLCVTHLASIAAMGHHHFVVSKAEVGGRTETSVERLEGVARRDEIARMMGGAAVTAEARAHADAMLAAARPSARGPARPVAAERGRTRGSPRPRV
ncbi:MAG TPA: DNA repair protein RecN, partial [Kofleriaceae bacterium]|nr:DNA repair protein RecN [Kofleriaceae bacterium]